MGEIEAGIQHPANLMQNQRGPAVVVQTNPDSPPRLATLQRLLQGNLEFHEQDSSYLSHNIHAFAAKFPPQLPSLFIKHLTAPGEVVLDPMMGSGTAVLEAALAGRRGIGVDIDPLAVKVCKVKTTPIGDLGLLGRLADNVVGCANDLLSGDQIDQELKIRFDPKTRAFIDYWFLPHTQRELMSLLLSIQIVAEEVHAPILQADVRDFLHVVFSSIIVTKSGGVSKARDLAHGRPHIDEGKAPRNAIQQFRTRARKNIQSIKELASHQLVPVDISLGDARNLSYLVKPGSVHLVVTSPPYANAIDYMRAHKFALVWMGLSTHTLTSIRGTYIGSERNGHGPSNSPLPDKVETLVANVAAKDRKQGQVLRRYLEEMRLVLKEICRVLRKDSAAVIVVGPSSMRGIRVDTADCLAEVASNLGPTLLVAGIGARKLDRDRRMMPARNGTGTTSMIEQRMHEEHILGLYKP